MKMIKITIWIILGLALAGLGLGFFNSERLPKSAAIVPELKNDPRQTPAETAENKLVRGGYTAKLSALHSYEISGLIVEEYTADNWLDITHKNDPFNTRDLCLVWGEDASGNIYDRIDFSHGEFTCFYQTYDREAYAAFRPDQLSNNHLIPVNDEVGKVIKKMRIGDQVRLKGELVNLAVAMPDGREWTRDTSVTRSDTGNGACELIYVSSAEILRTGNAVWRLIFRYSLVALLTALTSGLTLFFAETALYFRRRP